MELCSINSSKIYIWQWKAFQSWPCQIPLHLTLYTVPSVMDLCSLESIVSHYVDSFGLPWWSRWYRISLQCRRPRLHLGVGKIPWRKEWLSTPVILPGEFHGQRSLVGYSPWHLIELFTSLSLVLVPPCSCYFFFLSLKYWYCSRFFLNHFPALMYIFLRWFVTFFIPLTSCQQMIPKLVFPNMPPCSYLFQQVLQK